MIERVVASIRWAASRRALPVVEERLEVLGPALDVGNEVRSARRLARVVGARLDARGAGVGCFWSAAESSTTFSLARDRATPRRRGSGAAATRRVVLERLEPDCCGKELQEVGAQLRFFFVYANVAAMKSIDSTTTTRLRLPRHQAATNRLNMRAFSRKRIKGSPAATWTSRITHLRRAVDEARRQRLMLAARSGPRKGS